MPTERPAGFTLVEAVVALVAFAVLGTLAARGYAEVASASGRLARASDELWALRAVRWVLREELAAGVPGRDWWAYPPDSVRLRAFRSTALVCAAGPDSTLVVIRDGGRRPDPAKDSVLALDGSGAWSASALEAVGAGSCPAGVHGARAAGEVVERWRLDPPLPDAVLARVFERGSYHLDGRALRYRRGAGGRQPLTAEALEGARLVDSLGALRAVIPRGARPPVDLRVGASAASPSR